AVKLCPYGQPGDRLWVRETFAIHSSDEKIKENCVYRADNQNEFIGGAKWTPSIFMPRWASRITLEIVSVRIERVQSITEKDAIAEGVVEYEPGLFQVPGTDALALSARGCFSWLWDSINAKRGYGWDA